MPLPEEKFPLETSNDENPTAASLGMMQCHHLMMQCHHLMEIMNLHLKVVIL